MGNTTISWTDKVWNPVTGCTKVSAGCKNCYAEKMAKRFWGKRKFTDIICHEDRLNIPLKIKKPFKWFVNSMSDLFHESVSFDFIDKVFAMMALCPQHTFQILTKRPERMLEYFSGKRPGYIGQAAIDLRKEKNINQDSCILPLGRGYGGEQWFPLKNVWLGVSVSRPEDLENIRYLLQCEAAVRFLSIEPMLKNIIPDLKKYLFFTGNNDEFYCEWCGGFKYNNNHDCYDSKSGIDWIIVGGESGRNARAMHPDWVLLIKNECELAEIPFFFKQWGEWMPSELWDPRLAPNKQLAMKPNGEIIGPDIVPQEVGAQRLLKIGVKIAGCLLDGKEYKQFPEIKNEN